MNRKLQKFFKLRLFLTAVVLSLGAAAQSIANNWLVPNYAPTTMFADDPTNVYGVPFLQSIGPWAMGAAVVIVILLFVPEIKAAITKAKAELS